MSALSFLPPAAQGSDMVHSSKGGYLHPGYARSLAEFGQPYYLPRCDGWLLRRQIPGTALYDAMGCYPLFCCSDWSALAADLASVRDEFVSIVLVTDPFAEADEQQLRSGFDQVVRFKEHYVTELGRPLEQIVKKSHRATVRRSLRKVDVALCSHPPDHLDQWMELFENLVRRYDIRGLRAFSRAAFAAQLELPGAVLFAARSAGELVGLDLWYVQGDVAYGHLVAVSGTGYKLRASYAMKWHLLHYFRGRVRWIDFGGAAGTASEQANGLTSFKQGWSSHTKPVYLCLRTCQPHLYEQLTRRAGAAAACRYLPAYRHGEFA